MSEDKGCNTDMEEPFPVSRKWFMPWALLKFRLPLIGNQRSDGRIGFLIPNHKNTEYDHFG